MNKKPFLIMISGSIIFIMLVFAVSGFKTLPSSESDKIPQIRISNGIINATVYLPDTVNGYYRGARFDWSGVMPELTYKGHSYFGQWYEMYDPFIHDAIMGPVNDFYPLGYAEGKPGDNYVKIGIGVFTRSDTLPYSFSKPAKLINPGMWKVTNKNDQVKFTHTLDDLNYPYEYTKTIYLEKNKPVMVIKHTIKNRGSKTIGTNVYDHNFFVIDKQPTGPDFSVEFPFKLIGKFRRGGDKAEFRDNKISLLEVLTKGQTVHGGNIEGFGISPEDYDIKIENRKTGAGVRITCDKPLSRLVFWASNAVLSPEPYTDIKILPSGQFSWTITYQFYTLK